MRTQNQMECDVTQWSSRNSWIAVFDILGFKSLIREADRDFQRALLTNKLDELLGQVESDAHEFGNIDFMVISDTIVVFAEDIAPASYPYLLLLCGNLMYRSIYVELPLRGALSAGKTFTTKQYPTILIGPAFVEAYEYCEGQDWVGFLLAPSATRELRRTGLEPLHHDFVTDTLPLRGLPSTDVLAYRFQNGMANFPSPLLVHLRQMQHFAPVEAKGKYGRTIQFIERHYRYIND